MTVSPPAESDFPALYVVAEATANSAQTLFKRMAGGRLALLVAAAAIGVGAGISTNVGLSIAAVLLFLFAGLVELYLWKLRPEQTWYEGRAAAESVKTLAWRYAVGGEPFGKDQTTEPEVILDRQLEAVIGVLRHLALEPELGSGVSATPWMRQLRGASLVTRKDAYARYRVEDQQAWYARRSADHKRALNKWTLRLVAIEGLGLTAAILDVARVLDVDVFGLAGAGAAAIAAWIQTNQYRALQSAYVVTALELATLRDRVDTPHDEANWAQFVEEAEKAFSREHTLWKASRGVQSL